MINSNTKIKITEINFNLNLNLYKLSAIKHAIKDYKDIARITLKSKKENQANLTLKTNEDIPNIEHEFTNYVLGLMQN
jgi:hypothetical protein